MSELNQIIAPSASPFTHGIQPFSWHRRKTSDKQDLFSLVHKRILFLLLYYLVSEHESREIKLVSHQIQRIFYEADFGFRFNCFPSYFFFYFQVLLVINSSPSGAATMSGKSLLLKVILLGDGGVGKSSLMNRYVTNKFDSQAFHTIGVEFLNRDLEVDGRFVTLQIWDTAGQERFKSLRTPFYRGADCCLLTFSVDDRQSFENLGNWQKEFIYYADVKDPEHFPFVVLGNKVDKEDRQVTTEEAQAWCMENGDYPYLETSAKDDTNVTVAFEEAVRQVLAVEEQLEHCMLGHTIDLNSGSKAGSSCC